MCQCWRLFRFSLRKSHSIRPISYVVLSSADSCRDIHIYILDTYRRNDKQTHAMIETQWQRRRKTSLTKYLSLTLLQEFEKSYSRFACERELETEHNWNILTPNLWSATLCLSRSPGLLNRSPGVHYAGCWLSTTSRLSLSNSSQLFSFCSIRRPYITFKLPRDDMDTPLHLRNFFRYLAIGMCYFRYLWNGLYDRHRAEITVMQFTGHSLPVRQSMRV